MAKSSAGKILTGRAIVHFPYRSRTTRKTYQSILLGLERATDKYSLPGGKFNPSRDNDTLDTAIRELKEEFGLQALRLSAERVFTFHGDICDHDIYVVEAAGRLRLDTNELQGIGFFNAGKHNQIPQQRLERHVQALVSEYFGSRYERATPSGIIIPRYYFTGNQDPGIRGWLTQRNSF